MRTYIVGISKAYFPKSFHKSFTEFAFLCKVRASSRPEAVQKVWDKFGSDWLSQMSPKCTSVRKISLHVDDPTIGVSGRLGCLNTIEVYRD